MSRRKKQECDYNAYAKAYVKAVKKIIAFVGEHEKNNELDDENKKVLCSKLRKLDPDSKFYRIHGKGDVKCNADSLVSIDRLCKTAKCVNIIANEYEECRRTPIFYFPSVRGGINPSRKNTFDDRIDYTLYDIKNYCMGMKEKDEDKATKIINSCKLKKAYEKPKTKIWFESFKYDFKAIIDWYGVHGIFVNENYEVYDLESGNNATIKKYKESCKEYAWECNDKDSYYINLKKKIKEFEEKCPKTEETNP
jgi:hypothetical protein